MVEFQELSMVALGVILMINVGLVSVDASDTTQQKIFASGDNNGMDSFLHYEDLNSTFPTIKPTNAATGVTCDWWDLICSAQAVSTTVSEFAGWLGIATNAVLFFLKYIPAMLFGYHFVLMMIADSIEAGFGAIHLLLSGISAVIFIVMAYGVWGTIRSIASLVPGVG